MGEKERLGGNGTYSSKSMAVEFLDSGREVEYLSEPSWDSVSPSDLNFLLSTEEKEGGRDLRSKLGSFKCSIMKSTSSGTSGTLRTLSVEGM